MWSVGISVSPSEDALRLGYDARQINRIVIRMARYFLDKDMRVIFGHDWRNDGVMHAVADFAGKVELHAQGISDLTEKPPLLGHNGDESPRMLNVVPTSREEISRAALSAERDSGGVLEVTPVDELIPKLQEQFSNLEDIISGNNNKTRANKLTRLRHCITLLLNPGCRVCLGGSSTRDEGAEIGVTEEAKLALTYGKPLYLIGGFGGAVRKFGEDQKHRQNSYWDAYNGLSDGDKKELFDTTDVERAIRLVSKGIESHRNLQQ